LLLENSSFLEIELLKIPFGDLKRKWKCAKRVQTLERIVHLSVEPKATPKKRKNTSNTSKVN